MKASIVFQYLLDNLNTKHEISMTVNTGSGPCEIYLRGTSLRVFKAVECEDFPLTDPECHVKILEFIDKKNVHNVRVCMDDWFKRIPVEAASEILRPYCTVNENGDVEVNCPDYHKVYDQIWDLGMDFQSGNSFDDYEYYITKSKNDFEEWIAAFMENDGGLP